MNSHINQYKAVQHIANSIMSQAPTCISAGKTELDIKNACFDLIRASGITEFWYHNTPVIVAVGSNTTLSLSGKEYCAEDKLIEPNDWITIDLSLAVDNHWAILARSFSIEEGVVKTTGFRNPTLSRLQQISKLLHNQVLNITKPGITYHQLYHALQAQIAELDVLHLDFKQNFGHSIEKDLDARIYIADGVHIEMQEDTLFSFEPHLQFSSVLLAHKEADIYYFRNNQAYKI